MAEATRTLRPGGSLLLVDLSEHDRSELTARLAHRWPGFSAGALDGRMRGCGLRPGPAHQVGGALPVILFAATKDR